VLILLTRGHVDTTCRPLDVGGSGFAPAHRSAKARTETENTTFLTDPGAILDAIASDSHAGAEQGQLIERGRQIAEELVGHAPNELKARLMALLCRVEIRSDRIDILLSRSRLLRTPAGLNSSRLTTTTSISPASISAISLLRAGRSIVPPENPPSS
jgi:hypothetical protein